MYSSSPPPPGWYDNPVGDGQRFWDGQQWTRQVRLPWPEPGAPPPPSPPPPPGGRTLLQPAADRTSLTDYPATVQMPATRLGSEPMTGSGPLGGPWSVVGPGPTAGPGPLAMERVRRNAPGRGLSVRAWLAIGGVGVLAVVGAAAAASRSGSETTAGSAPGSTVAIAPLAGPSATDQPVGSAPAPAAAAVETSTTAPVATATVPATAAPTTAAPTTRPPTTAAPTTAAPTTREPATSAVETTVPNAVNPGAFCSPEGSTGVSAKGVAMICSSVNAEGVPYGEGKSRWRSA